LYSIEGKSWVKVRPICSSYTADGMGCARRPSGRGRGVESGAWVAQEQELVVAWEESPVIGETMKIRQKIRAAQTVAT